MSVMAVVHRHSELPEDPYDLWMRDELADILDLPHDGTRAEIIGGEIVVAPGPKFAHCAIVSDIHEVIAVAKAVDPAFRWTCVQMQDLNLSDIHDGYIPDLCIMDREIARQARVDNVHKLLPHQLAFAVEVTSPSTATEDRCPGPRRVRPSKWNGYARVGIGYYLIVDRDPKVAVSTLYAEPDRESGSYQESVSWKFGETIELPEPFGISIRTDEWTPWE
ncbi:Uma2 family endonuclease [Nocardia sp. NEAU-G5]|uniref:Uma2 family endonuclease n=1 Tax=Nocardia albiluteola TaxID=2842303 RepID=A0ABS6AS32_9NOCA|nr:Uma2 family endonuclease [Nocardia albiluteola]MBU3060698.1 Uma2 family endonuclease [Nocardia albiluteola]